MTINQLQQGSQIVSQIKKLQDELVRINAISLGGGTFSIGIRGVTIDVPVSAINNRLQNHKSDVQDRITALEADFNSL